jgi:hypothetical protein
MTHMAPEILIKGHISKAADVYAYGMVLVSRAACAATPRQCVVLQREHITHTHTHTQHTHTHTHGHTHTHTHRRNDVTQWELYTASRVFKGIPRALLGHQITQLNRCEQ